MLARSHAGRPARTRALSFPPRSLLLKRGPANEQAVGESSWLPSGAGWGRAAWPRLGRPSGKARGHDRELIYPREGGRNLLHRGLGTRRGESAFHRCFGNRRGGRSGRAYSRARTRILDPPHRPGRKTRRTQGGSTRSFRGRHQSTTLPNGGWVGGVTSHLGAPIRPRLSFFWRQEPSRARLSPKGSGGPQMRTWPDWPPLHLMTSWPAVLTRRLGAAPSA